MERWHSKVAPCIFSHARRIRWAWCWWWCWCWCSLSQEVGDAPPSTTTTRPFPFDFHSSSLLPQTQSSCFGLLLIVMNPWSGKSVECLSVWRSFGNWVTLAVRSLTRDTAAPHRHTPPQSISSTHSLPNAMPHPSFIVAYGWLKFWDNARGLTLFSVQNNVFVCLPLCNLTNLRLNVDRGQKGLCRSYRQVWFQLKSYFDLLLFLLFSWCLMMCAVGVLCVVIAGACSFFL